MAAVNTATRSGLVCAAFLLTLPAPAAGQVVLVAGYSTYPAIGWLNGSAAAGIQFHFLSGRGGSLGLEAGLSGLGTETSSGTVLFPGRPPASFSDSRSREEFHLGPVARWTLARQPRLAAVFGAAMYRFGLSYSSTITDTSTASVTRTSLHNTQTGWGASLGLEIGLFSVGRVHTSLIGRVHGAYLPGDEGAVFHFVSFGVGVEP